ncbi:MAG: hypothetical protein HKN36_11215 [Hellea sp.]|nr:hypothetical protein [Hellea sp.]
MLKRIFLLLSFIWLSIGLAFAADPFTVAAVPVDAVGANAIEAQTKANLEGQAVAAAKLLNRLTLPSERGGKDFSAIQPEEISRMIRALNVSNEKRSNQRYLGDITVAFVPSEVKKYLDSQGLTMISSQAGNRLVVPVLSGSPLWTENVWQQAWSSPAFSHALTPVSTIIPEQGNDTLISADQALAGDMTALKRLGNLLGARQILVATAEPALGGIRVRLSDISVDASTRTDLASYTAGSYAEASQMAIARLEDSWKRATVTLVENAVSMPVSVLYRSHEDWIWLQSAINDSAQIQGARLDALSKDGALMSVTYGGDIERLRTELSYKGVELREDPKLGTILFRKGRY